MPPCTTFQRGLASSCDYDAPCVGLNNLLRSTSLPKETVETVTKVEIKDPEALVATSEGTKVNIFDRNVLPFVSTLPPCSHTGTVISPTTGDIETIVSAAKGSDTAHACLMCRKVFLGEKGRSEMEDHFEVSGHSVCMSLADMSFWCFECDCSLDKNEALNLNSFHSGIKKLKDAKKLGSGDNASATVGVKRELTDSYMEQLLGSAYAASDAGDSISSWDPLFNTDQFFNERKDSKRLKYEDAFSALLADI
mmetsp:Transcript_14977/g.16951  ORF Transcript_14977/g.16951 Transcript_14977/m.16951 type:complete len:251 (-) Transcript_14977:1918-2670(-)|eukprot:CAMPEP_0184042662 /NCGR_PEP_ID=MMETSP0955-20130417/66474_1 /TAXON_ID=627963 /ORGANISM="Aplanochytrium sp, Strain PBS07" /LENGTH=250 /DNA_ID=CAMNT_0026333457 /DNA_START=399 /DNA_END=1151 /DNA_ORIENTATION=+